MKSFKRGLFTLFSFLPILSFSQSANGIKQTIDYEPQTIVDYGIEIPVNTRVPFRGDLGSNNTAGRLNGNAVFDVTYINFNAEQQAAVQYAVDIWSTLIQSDVPIRLRAEMSALDPGVLGSAAPTSRVSNFDNVQKFNTNYVIAMAEKIAGRELNDPEDYDISMNFSVSQSWYLGIDGNPASDEFDFVSIILHEIAHGLGFLGDTFVTDDGLGYHSVYTAGPLVYATSLETLNGTNVVESFENGATETGEVLTGENLFFNSFSFPTSDLRPKIYAPATYSSGSSISHLDSDTYPTGNLNSLMTPTANFGEVVHDPGLALEMFEDMGWIAMDIDFPKEMDSEDSLTDRTIVLTVKGDNAINTDGVNLHYTYGDFNNEVVVNMMPTGNVNEYTADIPATGFEEEVRYFINVEDADERTFTSPGESPQRFWDFTMATDLISPLIEHDPVAIIFLNDPNVSITASVTDNIGVGDLALNYNINNGINTSINVPLINSSTDDGFFEGQYRLNWDVSALELVQGDTIKYNLEIQDIAATPNITIHPSKNIHIVKVEDLNTPVVDYENDFNTATNDFAGIGFRIGAETGFSTNAIHSDHPYRTVDGAGVEDSLTLLYLLKTPIIVSDKNTSLVFDEIVLVEPGETGTVYGSEDFFDYVVVEGSNNFGINWFPIDDGYDSRAQPNWLDHYNSDINGNNSDALGNPSLFVQKEMDLTSNSEFVAGDTLLIRFRMYIDPFAHGWGWAIDNLKIQIDEEAPVITQVTPNYMFIGDTQITLDSKIEDISGLDSVVYEVDFNGQTELTTFPGTANLFSFDLGLPAITAGDVLKYRIIAVDKAVNPNTEILPEIGFFEIPVAVMGEAKSTYVNDFNTPSNDFIGSNFSITQPSGFVDPVIMSFSPYPDAPIDVAEMYYLLKHPIMLDNGAAWVHYNEIVLAETGNDKVAFDVSKDGGVTWVPVFDPYDASKEVSWFNTFNNFDNDGNSKGVGEPSMLVSRVFNILENPAFSGGDEVFVRFRMTVNDNVHGWGWAIDNLEIQGPTTGIEDNISANIQVYPNPSDDGRIQITGNISGQNSNISVTDLLGHVVYTDDYHVVQNKLNADLDLSHLRKGIYVIQVGSERGRYSSRVVIK